MKITLLQVIRLCFFALIINSPIALGKLIKLSPKEQSALRQAIFNDYSKKMQEGDWIDVIKEEGPKPLRMFDCLNNQCLIDIVASKDFYTYLYLVKIDASKNFVRMDPARQYGRVVNKAGFVSISNTDKEISHFIYVKSTTNMGTRAEELFHLAEDWEVVDRIAYRIWHPTNKKDIKELKATKKILQIAKNQLKNRQAPFVF